MARKIMITRHAEKPDGEIAGISIEGIQYAEELTPRGWQRSGALVRFVAPPARRHRCFLGWICSLSCSRAKRCGLRRTSDGYARRKQNTAGAELESAFIRHGCKLPAFRPERADLASAEDPSLL